MVASADATPSSGETRIDRWNRSAKLITKQKAEQMIRNRNRLEMCEAKGIAARGSRAGEK